MQVIILHDERRVDRFELFTKEFSNQGITDYLVFPAVFAESAKLGISRAHKNIIRYAKENKLEEICVFEDDVKFCFDGAFQYFLSKKPDEYSLFLTGIMWGRLDFKNIVDDFAGLQGYIAHNSFYDTFLSVSESRDIDRALRGLGKYVVCNPFACIQHETPSDNRKKTIHRNARHYFNRTLYNGSNG